MLVLALRVSDAKSFPQYTNTIRKLTVNPMPHFVAVSFVSRLIKAVLARIVNTARIPIGKSISPTLGLHWNIQRHPILPRDRSLNRNTAIDIVIKTNDQITPNAYASPSVSTSPRLATITISCSTATRLINR